MIRLLIKTEIIPSLLSADENLNYWIVALHNALIKSNAKDNKLANEFYFINEK